jgi:hypothetical protein
VRLERVGRECSLATALIERSTIPIGGDLHHVQASIPLLHPYHILSLIPGVTIFATCACRLRRWCKATRTALVDQSKIDIQHKALAQRLDAASLALAQAHPLCLLPLTSSHTHHQHASAARTRRPAEKSRQGRQLSPGSPRLGALSGARRLARPRAVGLSQGYHQDDGLGDHSAQA